MLANVQSSITGLELAVILVVIFVFKFQEKLIPKYLPTIKNIGKNNGHVDI